HGRREARRTRLSDVGVSTAPDWRPEHAARQQQPAAFATDRLPGDHGADGVRTRHLAGWLASLRPSVERADANQNRLRIRAGNPTPASGCEHAATLVLRTAHTAPVWRGGTRCFSKQFGGKNWIHTAAELY